MATYTQSLGLELVTPGTQAGLWGNTTNNSLQLIDQAIAGVTPVYLDGQSGFTYVLTDFNGAVDEARSAVLNVTYQVNPALGTNTVQIPLAQKLYVVRNSSGAPIVVKTTNVLNTVTIANGEATIVFCDGANAYPGIATAGAGTWTVPYGGTGVTTFGGGGFIKSPGGTGALTVSTTVNAATELSGTIGVANGGTGKTSFASGSVLLGNGVGSVAELVGTSANQVVTWNGSQWVAAAPSAAGVVSFNGRTGTVTPVSTDYSSFYYSTSNPSGYAPLSGANSWTNTNYFVGGGLPVRITGGSGQTLSVGGSNCNTTSSEYAIYVSTSTYALSIRGTGTYNATGVYGTISDVRKKEHIEPSRNYLADINKVNVVKYSLKSENSPVPTKLGVIAQELEQVFPGLIENGVDEDGNEEKSVKMSIFIPMLIKSVQELSAKLDAANAKIAALETK